MKRVFQPRGWFTVPDGTDVSAFLNATDAMQTDVPWASLGEMSIAAGRIAPNTQSSIHVHPVVTQVTYVLTGELVVRMKDASQAAAYDLPLQRGQAVVTRPGTLFQLRNEANAASEVLYIVSPSYVFEMVGDEVIYDDAILVARTWEELSTTGDALHSLMKTCYEAHAKREESKRRLACRKEEARPQPEGSLLLETP